MAMSQQLPVCIWIGMRSDKLLTECFKTYSKAKNYKIQINRFTEWRFFLLIRGEKFSSEKDETQ